MVTVLRKEYASFAEFYPAYLSEHAKRGCRELHFAGSTLALLCMAALLLTGSFWFLLAAVASMYGFAWLGYIAFEKNQPATWRHPLYSLMADWLMYWQMLTGQVSF